MNTLPSVLTASEARANLYDMLEEVSKYFKRFVITRKGKPQAIVLPIDEVESLEETAEILAIPGARESIKRGMAQMKRGKGIPFKDVLAKAV